MREKRYIPKIACKCGKLWWSCCGEEKRKRIKKIKTARA